MKLFETVGNDLFKVLTGKYQSIFIDCLEIIYDSYRTESSYGVDKEILIARLTDHFDRFNTDDIQFDGDTDIFSDPRKKANEFLRRLRDHGWVEYEYDNNGKQTIIMPSHSVIIMQAFISITDGREMEYQSEISAIYSLVTNEDLLDRPYPQVIKPVYERTLSFFAGLKKLNTEIHRYIDELTYGKTVEDIMDHFFTYNEIVGSKAYHRMVTNDNVSRFRSTIVSRLRDMLDNDDIIDRAVTGYQNIENENDRDEAHSQVMRIITDVIDHFDSYDDIENEIKRKHSKYLRSAVNRAKLEFLNTNDLEGKISQILRLLSHAFDEEEEHNVYSDVPADLCLIFDIFPQMYISPASLKTVAPPKHIEEIEEITSKFLTDEERIQRRTQLKQKVERRFSRKNIDAFVLTLLADKEQIRASEIDINCRRDLIRIIFIKLYSDDKRTGYFTTSTEDTVSGNGYTFNDFIIKKKVGYGK